MENKPRKIIRISRTKFIIGIVVVIIIALAAVVLGRSLTMRVGSGNFAAMEMASGGSVSSTDIPMVDFGGDYSDKSLSVSNSQYPNRYPTPYPNQNPDITDTREFLKVSYSAQIQTRDVADKVRDVKNLVRDAEGRVDNFSSSEKYGYVSFVVSKDKFDDFKDEVESLTKKKLYTENVSSQNLLGQKQNIEQQGESIETRLAELEKQKKSADAQHASRVSSLQNDLTATRAQIAVVVREWETSNSSSERARLQAEESTLRQRESTLQSSLNQENKTYTANNNSLVAQIAQEKKNLDGNEKQDVQFGNNIETVNGSVNVNWISHWQIMKLYSPIHPTIIIIVLALVLLYLLSRTSYVPKIELV